MDPSKIGTGQVYFKNPASYGLMID